MKGSSPARPFSGGWTTTRSRQLTVATGIMGEKVTEVSNPDLAEGMAIAVPLKRQDAKRKRRFGLSLF